MKAVYDNYKDLITDIMADMTEKMLSCAEQIRIKSDFSAYERGLNDAWECARKIGKVNWLTLEEMGFENKDKYKNPSWDVVMEYSASEAIAKIKEYEKQTNPISIDEAISNLKHGSSIPYKRETLTLAIKALERMKGETEE